ncbi:uncharacterized protein LOC126987007 [Eriocheir sinensis]|uniref:uncharacterized protein LOC126987007 n=1 Tax=Eriocheir sinensis TaxID=95602 RepID=UPI0021C92AAA|nr:uncharacterized protein LOC126987007 [Eriocheir sinensis]
MPSTCAVLWCSNDRRKTQGTGIRYFYFPKDNERQKQWIRACDRPDDLNVKSCLVCSKHFREEDYSMQYKLLGHYQGPRHRTLLKETAVPSLFLSPADEPDEALSSADDPTEVSELGENEGSGSFLHEDSSLLEDEPAEVLAGARDAGSGSFLHEDISLLGMLVGILKSVLALMKAKSDTMTEMEKVAVMSFDEMAIVSEWNYDKGSDTLYKPHKRVLVFMCKQAVACRRRAFNRYKRHRTEFNHNAYKKARAQARWTLKEARRSSFASYGSTLNSQTQMTQPGFRKMRSTVDALVRLESAICRSFADR